MSTMHFMAMGKGCLQSIVSCKRLNRVGFTLFKAKFSGTVFRCNRRKNNVILMGSPGSGKTTIGRILGVVLGKSVVDVDNDHLESYWGMPVSQKLQDVGDGGFVQAEGDALLNTRPENAVVSLSGSNPMHKEAMKHIRSTGITVFIDVQQEDILKRLHRMKVDRIVGQNSGVDMADILQYRQQFYEGNYDIRILAETNESPRSIVMKILKALDEMQNPKGYASSRGTDGSRKTFCDIVLEGLASDGGLYVMNDNPASFSYDQLLRLVPLSYSQRALRILEQWINPSHLHPSVLMEMVQKAYNLDNFDCHKTVPVIHLEGNQYISELFHGATASFKDAALQLMPQFFHHAVQEQSGQGKQHRYLILVATSGDTGGAVLDGFSKLPETSGINVMVLYPEEGISDIQKLQMTSAPGKNVSVIGVKSDFDFCQGLIKKIFNDKSLAASLLEKHGILLSAANSINWGRLLPQVVYHASSYLDLILRRVISMGDPVDLCIPTGNFGNIIAAYYAKEMGIPFRRLICASNVNNVLTEFFQTGCYNLTSRKLFTTASPAIDILKSSNLERFLYHASGNTGNLVHQLYQELDTHRKFTVPKQIFDKCKQLFVADWCDEKQLLKTISSVFKQTGYLLDPHTAVAKTVADRLNDPNCPMLIAATAHYAKFAPEVLKALGHSPTGSVLEIMQKLEEFEPRPKMHTSLVHSVLRPRTHRKVCDSDINAIVSQLENFVSSRKT